MEPGAFPELAVGAAAAPEISAVPNVEAVPALSPVGDAMGLESAGLSPATMAGVDSVLNNPDGATLPDVKASIQTIADADINPATAEADSDPRITDEHEGGPLKPEDSAVIAEQVAPAIGAEQPTAGTPVDGETPAQPDAAPQNPAEQGAKFPDGKTRHQREAELRRHQQLNNNMSEADFKQHLQEQMSQYDNEYAEMNQSDEELTETSQPESEVSNEEPAEDAESQDKEADPPKTLEQERNEILQSIEAGEGDLVDQITRVAQIQAKIEGKNITDQFRKEIVNFLKGQEMHKDQKEVARLLGEIVGLHAQLAVLPQYFEVYDQQADDIDQSINDMASDLKGLTQGTPAYNRKFMEISQAYMQLAATETKMLQLIHSKDRISKVYVSNLNEIDYILGRKGFMPYLWNAMTNGARGEFYKMKINSTPLRTVRHQGKFMKK